MSSFYFLVFNHNGTFFCCAVASYLYGHIHAFFCVERNKCSPNVRTATGNQSGPRRGRSVQFLTNFFITAPRQRRQHLHLAAPTFCSHYIWIKAIEWIDTSALASGRALKWRRTKRLFVYVLQRGERCRWSNLQLSPLIIRAVTGWEMEEVLCSMRCPPTSRTNRHPGAPLRMTRLVTPRSASSRPIERDRPRAQPRLNGTLACFDGDDGRSVSLEIWSRK